MSNCNAPILLSPKGAATLADPYVAYAAVLHSKPKEEKPAKKEVAPVKRH
jgi:hypothetical protein